METPPTPTQPPVFSLGSAFKIVTLLAFVWLVICKIESSKLENAIKPGQVWVYDIHTSDNPWSVSWYETNTVLAVSNDWVRHIRADGPYTRGEIKEEAQSIFKRFRTKLSDPPAFVEKLVMVTNTVVKEVKSDLARDVRAIKDSNALILQLWKLEQERLKPKVFEFALPIYTNYPIFEFTNSTNTITGSFCLSNMSSVAYYTNNFIFGQHPLTTTNFTRPSREIKRGVFR